MEARYRGTCRWCPDPIEPGQKIVQATRHQGRTTKWGHETCRPQPQPQTKLIGTTGAPVTDDNEDRPPWEP
jgi:hypothetical protein